MKKILCLTFVLFANIGIFAQEKTIQKAEFDRMLNTSFRLLSDKAYRITETYNLQSFWSQKSRSNNSPPLHMHSSKDIIEVLPGVGRHSIYETNSRLGKTKREFFSIGDKQYIREKEGIWLVRIIEGAAKFQFPSHTLNTNSNEKNKEYKFLGNEMLNNQNTKVYLVARKNQPANPKTNSPAHLKINGNILKDITCQYWFGKDGILLKSECKTEFYGVPRESTPLVITHSIKLYEIDPKIKIIAPKVK